MRNINFGIGVLRVKANIGVFFVTSFLCSLKFLLFHRIEYPKKFFYVSVFISRGAEGPGREILQRPPRPSVRLSVTKSWGCAV